MAGTPRPIRRINLLGADVDLITRDGVIERLGHLVADGRKAIIANQNLHSLYLSRRDHDMAAFFAAAEVIEIDSMPMVYWGRLLGFPAGRSNRCTYLDWRDQFWRAASEQRWRVYCLGARPGIAAEAVGRLGREWRGIAFRSHHGYFDHTAGSAESQAVVDDINDFRPDVLLVGMGMPIQENWIGRNYDALVSGVVLSVGAAFDYEVGLQHPAPRFLGALCLEWLYRFLHRPRRLFRRYMIEPWFLIGSALEDLDRYVFDRRPPAPRRLQGSGASASASAASGEDASDLSRAA